MITLETIITNGFIPLIPIFIWNIAFYKKLPKAYGPNIFDANIPKVISSGETIFRCFVFILPLFFILGKNSSTQKFGIIVFALGALLYFSSWLMLIYKPESKWSNSAIGFTAPAYTPIVWFIGLSLTVENTYYTYAYSPWHYIVPAILLTIFHLSHSVLVFKRSY